MKALSIAASIAVSSMAALTYAQGFPTPRPADEARRQQSRQEIQRLETVLLEREQQARTGCDLPDGTTHRLNAEVRYEGQAYRCVEVFTPTAPARVPPGTSQTLTVRMAGWIKI